MGDEVKAIAWKARWKWLRALTLGLWIAFALCAAMLFGGLAMLENELNYPSVYMSLFDFGVVLQLAVLFTAPAAVLLHVVALVADQTDTRTAYLGIFSGVIIGLGDMAVINYGLSRIATT